MGKKYIKGGNIYKEVGEYFLHLRHGCVVKLENPLPHYI